MMLQKSAKDSAVTISLLIGAAICEVCGGWCIWKWRREGWHWWIAIFGSVVLITSGILPTLQKQEFNRTYALYGGFFIVASFLWGWALDKAQPDLWDAIGSVITLTGVLLIILCGDKRRAQRRVSRYVAAGSLRLRQLLTLIP